ncbi:MAG: NUDIX domain-containing protein [Bacteroidota bacterium]
MNDYIKKIRGKIGCEKLIHPAARIIIENKVGQVLFIKRKDNELLGIPAGAFEANETIEDCIVREVLEETGIEILHLEVIGISSNPSKETVKYPNKDEIQYFVIEFYSNEWAGIIKADNQEVSEAKFMSTEKAKELPYNEQSAFESLAYYRKYNKVRVS